LQQCGVLGPDANLSPDLALPGADGAPPSPLSSSPLTCICLARMLVEKCSRHSLGCISLILYRS
jgi:hypothetical protein